VNQRRHPFQVTVAVANEEVVVALLQLDPCHPPAPRLLAFSKAIDGD
jgi:hypothetical protein